jgi:hypothetical protein
MLSQWGGLSIKAINFRNVCSGVKKSLYLFVLCMLVLLIFDVGNVSFAADTPEADAPRQPRIGLVLGGGGAKGAAHMGVR